MATQHHWLVRGSSTRDCNDPLFGQLLAQRLPPTGAGVLHVCRSISSVYCTWVSWPKREVVHSDTVRRRSAVPPSVMASAVFEWLWHEGALRVGQATRSAVVIFSCRRNVTSQLRGNGLQEEHPFAGSSAHWTVCFCFHSNSSCMQFARCGRLCRSPNM